MNKPNWTILHNKLPPTQRVGLVRPRLMASHAQLSFFFLRRSFFARGCCSGVCAKRRADDTAAPTARMRWTGQIFWLLALFRQPPESPSSRLHPQNFSGIGPMGSRIQLQQRNCSRFSRDFLRRPTFPSSQRTGSRSSGLRLSLQELFNQPSNKSFLCHQLTLA
jgi:hypothetical protein